MDYKDLPKPFFALAPMDDVTDVVFRRVVADCAPPDLFFTEFVNVDGLMSPGRPKLLKKLRFSELDRPLVAQIWGIKPENFKAIAGQVADGSLALELGLPKGVNFAGVDLNMGCPAKSEVKNGTCSALINDRPRAKDIIDATRDGLAGRLPLSVKTRLGFSEVDMTWIEFLLKQNLNMLGIHGRTRKQMSKVPADWDLIGQAVKLRDEISPGTLIVGNGDVQSRSRGLELAKKYNLDGIMIGRGVFHDPFIFCKVQPCKWENYDRESRIELYRKHVQLFADTWQRGGQRSPRPIHTLNKFCKIYINDFDGAKELREQLMAGDSTDQLLSTLAEAQQVTIQPLAV